MVDGRIDFKFKIRGNEEEIGKAIIEIIGILMKYDLLYEGNSMETRGEIDAGGIIQ